MMRRTCTSELVARERRAALSHDDRLRLDAHLATCAECRMERRIGADFDAVGAVRPGDDVLDTRLAEAVARRLRSKRALRPGLARVAAIAAAVLVAAGAAAHVALVRREVPPSTRGAALTLPPASAKSPARPVETAAPAEVADQLHSATPAAEPEAAAGASSTAPAPGSGWAAPAPTSPRGARALVARPDPPPAADDTASSLFEAANAERRRNHFTAAISLYDELQRRFPASTEAHVSHVSLGRLLLERGLWADAVPQLDAYLATGGTLAPEALFGKARALDAVGRRDDGAAAWRELARRYPDSVYAAQAEQRLGALGSPRVE
jgi:TolA-binding protein